MRADVDNGDSVSVDELARGVRSGDRSALARAITLVESDRPEDRGAAARLLDRVADATGGSHRIGITGLPGVGKSTLIDALGMLRLGAGERVAVLAVDPTSRVSGGSILGDKTRMARLAREEAAFIRPSPSSRGRGGVAARTHEAILLCEAAGYPVLFVETVGVGQAETAVADLVDTFVALMLPGAGDELQAIKKGLIELADIVVVNKADGDGLAIARETAAEYNAGQRYTKGSGSGWRPRTMITSARTGEGLDELWQAVVDHREWLGTHGLLEHRRRDQQVRRFWELLDERLIDDFRARMRRELAALEARVLGGELSPSAAAAEIVAAYAASPRRHGETDSH